MASPISQSWITTDREADEVRHDAAFQTALDGVIDHANAGLCQKLATAQPKERAAIEAAYWQQVVDDQLELGAKFEGQAVAVAIKDLNASARRSAVTAKWDAYRNTCEDRGVRLPELHPKRGVKLNRSK